MDKAEREKLREFTQSPIPTVVTHVQIESRKLIKLLDSYERLVEALKGLIECVADEGHDTACPAYRGMGINCRCGTSQVWDEARQALAEVEND